MLFLILQTTINKNKKKSLNMMLKTKPRE